MQIVWDDHKRQFNLDKHGFDFADFKYEFLDDAFIEETHSNRFKAIFLLSETCIAVVFGLLGNQALSLISMRRASKKERDNLS